MNPAATPSPLPPDSFCAERARFATDGFVFFRSLLGLGEIERLRKVLAPLANPERPGRRGLLRACPEIAALANDDRIIGRLTELGGAAPFPVRGILFDKTSRANWSVAWHQDLAVAIRARAEVPGFGPWSVKDGTVHAHAPIRLLERMFTVRLHLDHADDANGPLRVIPGSHLRGKLVGEAIELAVARETAVTCTAGAGDLS